MPRCRCCEQAVEATKSLDDQKLADYIRATTFKTVLGDVKFGKGGEWAGVARAAGAVPERQGQRPGAVQGASTRQVVVSPPEYASGKLDLSLREGEVGTASSRPRGSGPRRFSGMSSSLKPQVELL